MLIRILFTVVSAILLITAVISFEKERRLSKTQSNTDYKKKRQKRSSLKVQNNITDVKKDSGN